jgi:diaminopropionate ammonia-lyase
MGGMSFVELSLFPCKIIKNSVNNCLSLSDDNIATTVAMLAKSEFSNDKIIGGECSAPGIMSLIMSCNNKKIKQSLDLNDKSNVLLIGCEGDTDTTLYNRMISLGNETLK